MSRYKHAALFSMLGVAIISGVLVAIHIVRQHPQRTTSQYTATNMLQPNDFSWKLAGVSADNQRLSIKYTGLAIVHQDGSPNQINPPANLAGDHFAVSGDFTISATMEIPAGDGAITLYGQPPIISDESRSDPHTLRISINTTTHRLTATLTNGSISSGFVFNKNYAVNGAKISLTLQRHGGSIMLSANGQQLGGIPESGLFGSSQLWLGLDTQTPGSTWYLSAFSAKGSLSIEHATVSVTHGPGGLNEIAATTRPGFRVGTSLALGPLVSNKDYTQLALAGNFGIFTPENAMKAQFIHPQPDIYTFEEADQLVAIARGNGLAVHGHALVFGEANPEWMQTIARGHPEQLQAIMVNHIKTIVSHYKGKVQAWDVVNEPLADYNTTTGQVGLRQNIWYKAMGPQYIAIALQAAHEADPSAQLWINDFGMEYDDDRFATMLSLIKQLKQDNVPIYGVGFQAHIDETDAQGTSGQLARHFSDLEAVQIRARISELDISDSVPLTTFGVIAKTCIQHQNCTDVTFWGVSNAFSSGADINGNSYTPADTGLPWDRNFRETSAVSDLRRSFASR